ncbi:unnamed protein product [Rotaria socialis]|uniref:Uncharacterized protein n=2 Tax=Rotaria socialis TaxID=392032 RepID=A0A817WET5_9BILA|nr:unnamed protein product [Rotaria socialis]CAF3354888.1 unnamed protein product [Rotaria socialis]
MSLVRQGNISMLEEYLSPIPNPDRYLNRVFGDEFMQQCSLLTIACLNEHINLMRVLIKRFQLDLEIKNDILFGDGHKNNDANFAVSVYRKHLKMASYLVDKLDCDLVQFLLDHDARNFPAMYDQVSPLMWAVEKKRTSIVNAIRSHCPLIEQIEAEELLALELRSIHNLPKTLQTITTDVFNYRQECQTIDHLNKIYSNTTSLCIEALLMRERLLGSKNCEYRYSIRYHGAVFADNNQHMEVLAFCMYEIRLREEYSIPMDSEHLRHFTSIFSEMLNLSLFIPIQTLLTVIKITAEELQTIDRQKIHRRLCSVVKHKYVTLVDRSSFLHLSLNSNTSADDFCIEHTCKCPCILTARTLLQCGADVNAHDALRMTPLHVFLSSSSIHNENLLKLLCDDGAHLDYVYNLREKAIHVTTNLAAKQLIKSKMQINLKCLCARLIQLNNVPFHGELTSSLVRFVEEH